MGAKYNEMVLQKESKLGLTFGQILSVLTIIGGILISWVAINVRIAQAEVRIEELEKGRLTNSQNIEQMRRENRDDHLMLMEKLDQMLYEKRNYDNR